MIAAFVFAAVTLVLFLASARIFALENHRGRRMFASSSRTWLDERLHAWAVGLDRKVTYISRYIITLSWYYSLHAFLKLLLQSVAGVYYFIEKILHQNRDRARVIRIEKKKAHSHLSQIAEHKTKTALTPAEKAKRKEKALSGK
jgi:hypothetical protein